MSKQQVLPNPSGVLGRGIVVLVDGDYQASVQDASLDITAPGALITLPQNPTVGDTTIEVLAEVACRFTAGPAGPPLLPSDPLPVAAGSNFLLAFTRGGWRIFGSGAGVSGIAIENSGVPLAGGPFTTVNLEPGLTATDAGGGVANVVAAGAGAVTAVLANRQQGGTQGNPGQSCAQTLDPLTTTSGAPGNVSVSAYTEAATPATPGDNGLAQLTRNGAPIGASLSWVSRPDGGFEVSLGPFVDNPGPGTWIYALLLTDGVDGHNVEIVNGSVLAQEAF